MLAAMGNPGNLPREAKPLLLDILNEEAVSVGDYKSLGHMVKAAYCAGQSGCLHIRDYR